MRNSKTLLFFLAFFLSACSTLPSWLNHQEKLVTTLPTTKKTDSSPKTASFRMTRAEQLKPGRLVIIQTATSETETYINVLAPRLKSYQYSVTDRNGTEITAKKIETVQYGPVFFKVDKIHVSGLTPGKTYDLKVIDVFRQYRTVVDSRTFGPLDLKSSRPPRFALLSCLSDDWRFEEAINPMWARLRDQKPDFVIMNGDIVYVDSFDFVERGGATEQDLWLRYIDSFRRIPYFHEQRLTPTLATWDDHDYGTNDGDRTFLTKDASRRVFRAFFGSPDIPGVFQTGPGGTYSVFSGYGQRFYLMDNRTHRQPNKNQTTAEPFAHWGEQQHMWLMSSLKSNDHSPAWLINGTQFFNGKSLSFKEAFEENHPTHFHRLLEDLKTLRSPILFASGDTHFSELMRIPAKRGLNYDTYEITSSAMHSYAGEGWDNPLRVPGTQVLEFNFLMIESTARNQELSATIRSLGLKNTDYFKTKIEVSTKP